MLTFEQLRDFAQYFLSARSTWEWNHCLSVATLAHGFASHIGMADDDRTLLYQAGCLHDIGKILAMDKVLSFLPPEALSPAYIEQIQQHPIAGKDIADYFLGHPEITRLIAGHHCRLPHISTSPQKDCGYPADYCKGVEFDLKLAILVLSDCFDAMAGVRDYRKPVSKAEALRELRHESMKGALPKETTEQFCRWVERR